MKYDLLHIEINFGLFPFLLPTSPPQLSPDSYFAGQFCDYALYLIASAVFYTTTSWIVDCSPKPFKHEEIGVSDFHISAVGSKYAIVVNGVAI